MKIAVNLQQHRESLRKLAKIGLTKEALYGRNRFLLPDTIGKVESKFGFVNCTFVSGASGRFAVFVEHVLVDDNEKCQNFRITYHNKTSETFEFKTAKVIAPDLVAVPLPAQVKQQCANLRKPDDSVEEVYIVAYDKPTDAIASVSQGRLYDRYHNCGTIPGNCSGPLYSARDMKVIGFHQGTIPDEKINVCIPVGSSILAAIDTRLN
jgi:hypothetical protein